MLNKEQTNESELKNKLKGTCFFCKNKHFFPGVLFSEKRELLVLFPLAFKGVIQGLYWRNSAV